ncbi:MAG TPA: lantibiotic dehydratase [Thermoanaerobaculia bacterium]
MPGAAAIPPLVARIAGLPATALAPFSHPPLTAAIEERERLQTQLDETRTALVESLHRAIRRDSNEERRFLLAVKRRCFNAGRLAGYRADPSWPLLAEVAHPWIEAAVALEDAVAALDVRIDELYRRALLQERRSLAGLLEDRAFVRGVTLASQVVARNLGLLRGRQPADFGRREKRLCLTLLRYLGRAALKPSPFSTLTRVGLVSTDGPEEGDFALAPSGDWRERSTAALHRELLAQWSCLLLRCRPFAAGLPVALNDTLATESDGRCSFFRPGHWVFDDDGRAFRYAEAAFTRARLEGPLISWLRDELRDGPQIYGRLLARARARFGDEGDEDAGEIESGLEELRELDFLSLLPPWDFNAPDLEERILAHLEEQQDPAVSAFRSGLRELTDFLRGYSGAASPVRFLGECKERVEGLFRSLVPAAGLPPDLEFQTNDSNFEEEVFLRPAPDRSGETAIAHLSSGRARGLLDDLEPLCRLTHLHSSTHDFLHTLAAFGERRWPGVEEIGLLELFGAAQPLFNHYLGFRQKILGSSASVEPEFNPLDLAAIRDLAGWRRRIEEEIEGCIREDGETQCLCPRALGALLDQAPARYTRAHDVCALVQPLDGAGRTWVVNAMVEGYGRYSSRFTLGMDAASRERWISGYLPLSRFDLDGEPVELVDLSVPGVRTLNTHAVQTRRVLKMPGEASSLPAERVLRLRDLRVRLRGADGFPALTDAAGQRLLPIAFGSLATRGRPTLLKFLGVFGPGDLLPRKPVKSPRLDGGIAAFERHAIGTVVYSRRKWCFDPRPLLAVLAGQSEARAFRTLHRWRVSKGLPERAFAREHIPGARAGFKPQYVDFSSPTFLHIFQAVLSSEGRTLILEEALPDPQRCPAQSDRWSLEIQLESFGFRRQRLCLPRDLRGDQQQPASRAIRKESCHEKEQGRQRQ